jgi:hypothetical protein
VPVQAHALPELEREPVLAQGREPGPGELADWG